MAPSPGHFINRVMTSWPVTIRQFVRHAFYQSTDRNYKSFFNSGLRKTKLITGFMGRNACSRPSTDTQSLASTKRI